MLTNASSAITCNTKKMFPQQIVIPSGTKSGSRRKRMLIKIRNKTSGIRTSIRTVNWTKRVEQDSECWRPQCNMKLKCAISKGYVFPSQVTNATGKNYHDHLKKTYWSSFLQSEILPKQEPKLQAKSHGWFDRTKTRLRDVNKNVFAAPSEAFNAGIKSLFSALHSSLA